MRFLEDGTDIPDDLIRAVIDGSAVFLCGALVFLLSDACKELNSAAEGNSLKAGIDRTRVSHLGVLVCAKEFVQRFRGKAFRSALSEK